MYGLSVAATAFSLSNILLISATHLHGRAESVNGFTYTSCQSAYDFLPTELRFTHGGNSSSMTVEVCTSACAAGYAFAALYGSQCFCGQTFTAIATGQDAECNTPCPGNDMEICGGFHDVARGSEWWSLYSKKSSNAPTTVTITVIEVSKTSTVTDCPTLDSMVSYPANTTGPMVTSSVAKPGSSITNASVSVTSAPAMVSMIPYKGAADSVRVRKAGFFIALAGLMMFI